MSTHIPAPAPAAAPGGSLGAWPLIFQHSVKVNNLSEEKHVARVVFSGEEPSSSFLDNCLDLS